MQSQREQHRHIYLFVDMQKEVIILSLLGELLPLTQPSIVSMRFISFNLSVVTLLMESNLVISVDHN
jgi:hypothetical protein